ncbi:pentatricopeptide repeat-containing protein 5, mitochondrial [Ceratobasidium sp. AG-Ba]|nr:pentatricopeptide repeat-containing protein 5, mitochondrial [Ceratobasidium sp. AG-Ba]
MEAFRPFGQLEYQPIQIAPPQSQYTQFSTTPQPQPQPSLSPHPTTPQPGFQPQRSHPIVHTPQPTEYSIQDPFQWMLSSFTALLKTHQLELNAKLEELVGQQNTLSAKLDTVHQSTNSYQDDIASINSTLHTISEDVSQLGKDMASRDAMLAERLNALDDAIDPEGKFLGATTGPSESLRTPPASDVQPNGTSVQREREPGLESESHLQQAALGSEATPAYASASKPKDKNIDSGNGDTARSLDRLSSALSSPGPNPQESSQVAANITPPRPKAVSKVLQKVKQLDVGAPESPRRSGRTPKKRNPGEALVTNTSTPSKKRKSITHDELSKTPAKKLSLKKPATEKFDWSTVPFRGEGHLKDQLIQCETCDIWYHWTCVNIDPEDPMLHDEDLPWACPPCAFEAGHGGKSKAHGRPSSKHTRCRPDCDNDHGPEKFVIESIVGRFPDYPKNTMQYLLKWEGYPLAEATWTPELEIGNSAPVLVQKFETVAKEEGHDLLNWRSLILLQEASDAGWAWNQAPAA